MPAHTEKLVGRLSDHYVHEGLLNYTVIQSKIDEINTFLPSPLRLKTKYKGVAMYEASTGTIHMAFSSQPDGSLNVFIGYLPDDHAPDIKDKIMNVIKNISNTEITDVGTKDVPSGSEDPITREDIKNGDKMIDFDKEYSFGRYYHESTYPHLRGKNPFTNNEIDTSTVQKYTAKVTEGGKRRKKTLRRRKTRTTRKKTLRRRKTRTTRRR